MTYTWEVSSQTPKWANDDSKFVEFLSIHILLTLVWLVFTLQCFSIPVFMTVSILVNKLDNSRADPQGIFLR